MVVVDVYKVYKSSTYEHDAVEDEMEAQKEFIAILATELIDNSYDTRNVQPRQNVGHEPGNDISVPVFSIAGKSSTIAPKLNNDWNTSQYWSTEIGILMMDDIKYFEGTKMNIYTSERASD